MSRVTARHAGPNGLTAAIGRDYRRLGACCLAIAAAGIPATVTVTIWGNSAAAAAAATAIAGMTLAAFAAACALLCPSAAYERRPGSIARMERAQTAWARSREARRPAAAGQALAAVTGYLLV